MPRILLVLFLFISAFNVSSQNTDQWNEDSSLTENKVCKNGSNLRLDSIVRNVAIVDTMTLDTTWAIATTLINNYDSEDSTLPSSSERGALERTIYTYDHWCHTRILL